MSEITEIEKEKLVNNLIIKKDIWEAMGFKIKNHAVNREGGIGTNYVWEFENKNQKRTLTIIFSSEKMDFSDSFYISLKDDKEPEPLDLSQYLKILGFLDERDYFDLGEYKGEFTERLKKFNQFLDLALNEEFLKEVLSGKRWVNLPFDWGDYK